MSIRNKISSLLSICALAGFSVAFAQEPQQPPQQKEGERQRAASTITGCLAKGGTTGQYTITEKGGTKTTVAASAGVELDKHAANHTVTLTGSRDSGGTFTATKVEHVSATCDMQR
jgi:hypothetical protein